jgi:Tol biopolymer transport system component
MSFLLRSACPFFCFVWSPDGKQIAFGSARDGNLETYLIHAEGANLRRITNRPDRDDFQSGIRTGDKC